MSRGPALWWAALCEGDGAGADHGRPLGNRPGGEVALALLGAAGISASDSANVKRTCKRPVIPAYWPVPLMIGTVAVVEPCREQLARLGVALSVPAWIAFLSGPVLNRIEPC